MEIRASVRRELLLVFFCLALIVAGVTTGCRSRADSTVDAPPNTVPPLLTASATGAQPPAATVSALPTATATASPSPPPEQTEPTASPIASPTPAPTTTPPPTAPLRPPLPTPSPAGPTIHSFAANVEWADPGDVVTFTWTSEGATRAMITKLLPTGQLSSSSWDVALSGSMAYTIPTEERNGVSLMLYVGDVSRRNAKATATVRLFCPSPWFFAPPPEEDVCPTEPLISAAAEQRFEGGAMIWVEAEGAIYVLYGAGGVPARWQRFEDRWDETQPTQDPALVPPEGLQQPIRGFGLVWREQPALRQGLGWAIEGEQGYNTILQRTTRFKYNAWYLLALDDRIWYLGPEGSSWYKLTPEGFIITPDG